MAKIDAFFKLMNDQGASDLHLVSGQPPAIRLHGDIERIKYQVLTNSIKDSGLIGKKNLLKRNFPIWLK